jgi:hypothetical protein
LITVYKETFGEIVGGLYIIIALVSLNGAYGIFYEKQSKVKWFTRFFLFSLAIYTALRIIESFGLSISYAHVKEDCESANPVHKDLCSYSFLRWGFTHAISTVIYVSIYDFFYFFYFFY